MASGGQLLAKAGHFYDFSVQGRVDARLQTLFFSDPSLPGIVVAGTITHLDMHYTIPNQK
jgi:hypothetical protein